MAYERVNGAWPAATRNGRDLKPTAQEAVAACRRLYRFAMKKAFKGKVRVVSGNRHTYVRWGVLQVNPDRYGGGWHEIVHGMSHYCAYRLHPGSKAHGPQHHWIELQMIEHVVKSGWLDGKLRRPGKPPVDRAAVRKARLERRIRAWQAKARRAETALRKLRRQAKRHEIVVTA